MENAVCFIGHRKIENREALINSIQKTATELIEKEKICCFIFGDHSEFNSLCYNVISKLAEKYSQIKRIKFRKDYPEIDNEIKKYFLSGYDETIFPKKVLHSNKASYIKRNEAMIDESRFCVFYYNRHCKINSEKSGTAIAIHYAVSKNKKIINLFP